MSTTGRLSKVSFLLKYHPHAASSRVRGVDLAHALARRGVDCRVAHPGQAYYRLRYLRFGLRAGAAVFQKRSSPNDHLLLRTRKALGLTSAFDLDDAPGGIPHNAAEEARVIAMMRDAAAVTVGGHALRDFALQHQRHVELVPSAVDIEIFTPRPKARPEIPSLGWMGNAKAHLEDLLSFVPILSRLRQQRRARMIVVGAMGIRDVHEAFSNRDDEIIDSVDWTDSAEIAQAIGPFDIGIYPLRMTPTNKFTCGYKGIQYMAMGLPVVASSTGESRYIVSPGETGFIAETQDQWLEALTSLIDSAELRERLGASGRRLAVERYSTAVAARRLLDVLRRSREG